GVLQLVRLLLGGERAVDTHPDGAQAHGGQKGDDDLRTVRQACGNAVALADSDRRQRPRRGIDLRVELAVGEASRAANERLDVRLLAHGAVEDLGDRLRTAERDRRSWPDLQPPLVELQRPSTWLALSRMIIRTSAGVRPL